jgi:hypothetical protein
MSDSYVLGQRVTFTAALRRRYQSAPSGSDRSRRVWEPSPHALIEFRDGPVEGIIVGARTLSDGECEWNGYEEPTTYHPTRTFPAYLIAHHLRRRPVLVLPEHIQPQLAIPGTTP